MSANQLPVAGSQLPVKASPRLEAAGRQCYENYCSFLQGHGLLPPYALTWERMPDLGKQAWIAAVKDPFAE